MYGGVGYYECVLSVRGRQRGVLWLGEVCVCAKVWVCWGREDLIVYPVQRDGMYGDVG